MAAAVVQSASGRATTAPVTPALAGATSPGNIVVLLMAAAAVSTAPGSGWTQSSEMGQVTFHGAYLRQRVSAGETTFAYTLDGAARSSWVLLEISGLEGAPYDVSEGIGVQSSTDTVTTPDITPTAGERLLVAMTSYSHSSTDVNAPGTWTNSFTAAAAIASESTAGERISVGAATRQVTANGSTAYSTGTSIAPSDALAESGLIIAFKVATANTYNRSASFVVGP